MQKISFMLILLFLLLACASTKQYDTRLNQTIGMSKTELIEKLGQPSAKKILTNGDEVWAYTKVDNVFVPSEFYLYNQGNLATEQDIYSPFLSDYDFSPYWNNFGYEVRYFCQTAFVIQGGKVTAWKWRGNDCASK